MLCTPRVLAEHAPVHYVPEPPTLLNMINKNTRICVINENLAPAHSGSHYKRTAVIAYAGDVTIILRSPKDIPIV